MANVKNILKKSLKGLAKTLLILTALFFLLFTSAVVLLQFSSVQTRLARKATDYLSQTLKYPIKINSVYVNWIDEVSLGGITVHDPSDNEMIYLPEALVDFSISSLLNPSVEIDRITLRNGRVEVKKYLDGSVNITDFIDNIRDLAGPGTPGKSPAPFSINSAGLENMFFSYADLRKTPDKNGFDHNYFSFDSIYGDVNHFRAIADTLEIYVTNLRTTEMQTRLRVHKLDTRFMLTKHLMEFDGLYASIGSSKIQNYLRLEYAHIDDLSDFNEKVKITTQADNILIRSTDLAHFISEMQPFTDDYKISGAFKGRVNNFSGKDFTLSFGKKSYLEGKIRLEGLPDIEETFIEYSANKAEVDASDLAQYLNASSNKVLKEFGLISGKGQFTGFINDFVANGSFNTGLGSLTSDINLKLKEGNKDVFLYKGNMLTKDFALGKLTGYPEIIQYIDMEGSISGTGYTLQDASLDLKAEIKKIGIKNYNYQNIVTDARLSNKLFNGSISVRDTNLIFRAKGEVNLHEDKKIFNILAVIDRANLKPLNLSKTETLIKSHVYLNFRGEEIDDITGIASLSKTYLLYNENREVFIDTLSVASNITGNNTTFSLISDKASAMVSGDFKYTELLSDLERLYGEYRLNFLSHPDEISSYYRDKNTGSSNKYKAEFNFKIKDINTLLSIYLPGLYLSRDVSIKGNFNSGYASILNVYARADTIYFQENEFYNAEVDLSSSKLADSSDVLAMCYIRSSGQQLKSMPPTRDLEIEGVWSERTINFYSSLYQQANGNFVNLNGKLLLLDGKKELNFQNSRISLLNKAWNIAKDNKIYFDKHDIAFENFRISNASQQISLNGTLSENPDKKAYFEVKDFELETLNPLISETLTGLMNGSLTLRDIYKDLNLGGYLFIKNLTMNDFLIGNLSGKSSWNNEKRRLDVNLETERDGVTMISLKGNIRSDPNKDSEELNLSAYLDKADLSILAPLLGGAFSEVAGNITGDFKITGTLAEPLLKGKGFVQNGKIKVDYLGTTYYFSDIIHLEENLIGFKKLRLKDREGNSAIIDGGIFHDNFREFGVDIRGYMNNFRVLNTTEKDNNLFYGTAIVTGNMEIRGSFSNLEINANATSNKGTKIYIPLNKFEGLEQQSYIKFVSKGNIPEKKEKKESVDLSGIKMDLNLDITPDAYAEIIFDKKAGDIIRGNGNGHLKLSIDTRGDFHMYGDYVISKGAYNFTLAGLINKEFVIEPNSSISWSGDPYAGVLDINAYYSQFVSLTNLIQDSLTRVQPENKRKYPVKVLMNLEGDLMSPLIHLDIDIVRYPMGIAHIVTEFESRIKVQEQELNRQVFSLLVLRNFSPPDDFSGIEGSTGNLSELLSNQLSNWLSQVDDNLQIDLDLSALDREALNTFQLRLSYTLMDGRLRITRDGSFQNIQNTQQTSLTGIAGEWTVEYLLSQDGKFRLKLYNRNNFNALLNSLNAGMTTSAGFSLLHSQGFDKVKDIFKKKEKIPTEAIAEEYFQEAEENKEENIEEKDDEEEKDENGEKKNKDNSITQDTP